MLNIIIQVYVHVRSRTASYNLLREVISWKGSLPGHGNAIKIPPQSLLL